MTVTKDTELVHDATVRRAKTMNELRMDLSEALDQLAAGTATPAIVNARVNGTSGILRTYKFQMDYAKQTGKTPHIPELLTGPELDPA